MRSNQLVLGVVIAAAACGHAAPGPSARPSPAAAPPSAPEAVAPIASAEEAAASAPASAPAAPSPFTVAAPAHGCTFVAAAGGRTPAGISILGLGEGGGGFDMPDICPQQACVAGLTIDLPVPGGWAYGEYDVEVATDDGTLRCRTTAAAPPAWTAPARCAHVRELTSDCVGPAEPWYGPIMVSGAPAHVRVVVARDGVVLADQAMTPAYSNLRWDGWDCHPSCASAKASVTIR